MKKIIQVFLFFFCIALACLATPYALHGMKKMKQYNEAEPLVKTVWELSGVMKEYYANNHSNATSLQTVVAFSSNTQFMALSRYPIHFIPNGSNVVEMMVNEMFGFTISSNYKPDWIFPDN